MATLRDQLTDALRSRDQWKDKWERCAATANELRQEVLELDTEVARLRVSLAAAKGEPIDA